jgi:hypothetical protein
MWQRLRKKMLNSLQNFGGRTIKKLTKKKRKEIAQACDTYYLFV